MMASATPLKSRARRTWLAVGVVFVCAACLTAGFLYLGKSLAPARKPVVKVIVTSGDPVVRMGSSVTFSAIVESPKLGPVTLRLKPGEPKQGGLPATLPMTGDDKGAFHATLHEVRVDLDYRIEFATTASEWHHLTVLEPAEIRGNVSAEIQPPSYAIATLEPQIVDLEEPLSGLANSRVSMRLDFLRPASDAFVEFVPDVAGGFATRLPLDFHPPADVANLTFTLSRNGTVRIVTIVDEKGRKLQSVREIPVRVTADAPPRFEVVQGLPRNGGKIRPGALVAIEATATDDLGLKELWLESQFGVSAPPDEFPSDIRDGPQQASVSRTLRVPATLREGDLVKVRLRAVDSRLIPQSNVTWQMTTFPPSGWATFVVSATAPTPERQEIDTQHAELAAALDVVRQAVDAGLGDVAVVQAEAGVLGPLSTDQVVRLQNSEERILAATEGLRMAIANAQLAAELRPFSGKLRGLVERTLSPVCKSLNSAISTQAPLRAEHLQATLIGLREAQGQIASLRERNRRLAFHRRDRLELEAIAAEQRKLGLRFREDGQDVQILSREQQALRDRVQGLVRESPPLREAQEHLAAAEARRLTHEIESLLTAQRELGAAIESTRAEATSAIRTPLVRSQREIANRLGGQSRRLESVGRLIGVSVPKAEDARALADRLARGENLEVLIEQEKLSQSLEHLAQTIESWTLERQDSRLAALHLARWQEDLQARLRDATRQMPLEKLPAEVREALALEQAILKRTVERLPVPRVTGLLDLRTAAASTLGRAIALLARNTGDADATLTEAVQTLHRLAEQTPGNAARLKKSGELLEKIRLEQDAITAESALGGFSRLPLLPAVVAKLTSLQERQQKLADLVNSLDLPTLASRQNRIVETMKLAAEDLRQARPYDVLATQADLRRQIERLRLAIDGQRPADVLVIEAAREQSSLTNEIEASIGEPPRDLREKWRLAQDAIFKRLAPLVLPEAGSRLLESREAIRQVEAGFREGRGRAELAARSRAAAESLTKLADSVTGIESALDRLRRLADLRRQEGTTAIANPGTGAPSMADVELRTRLQREIEELQATRVGTAQEAKGRVLDRYTLAKQGGVPSQSIAEAFDELVAAVAEIPTLATRGSTEPPFESSPADDYLPSRSLAEAIGDLARRQRELRSRTTFIELDARKMLKLGSADKLTDVIRAQRFLARDASALAKDASTHAAAVSVRRAADLLRLGRLAEAHEESEAALRRWRGSGTAPLLDAIAGLVKRQEAILVELAKLPHPVATAAGQQKICQEELLLTADDLRSAAEAAARIHNSHGGMAKPPFAHAATVLKETGVAMTSLLAGLDRGMPQSVEKSVAAVTNGLQKASDALETPAHGSVLESGLVVEAASRIRDVELAMQAASQKAEGSLEDRQRSADAVNESTEKAKQALRSVMASIAP